MIQIDMKMPKSCRRCKLKVVEEDMCGDFFYYCPLISQVMRGKDKDKKHEDCPLREVEENKE